MVGSGPLGFQPGIGAASIGDDTYSPMWRIFLIEWNDADNASLLMTKGDIDAMSDAGMINIEIAMPMDLPHIVNCPFMIHSNNLTPHIIYDRLNMHIYATE